MIKRILTKKIRNLIQSMPVLMIQGPRQSGKTTLAQSAFPNYPYVNLEDLSERSVATEDPKKFLATFDSAPGLIIDEAQYAPSLFSYIQVIVDASPKKRFILTGSQNFLLNKKISQSLAVRVGILTLLPLSTQEIYSQSKTIEEYIHSGGYPPIYDDKRKVNPADWYKGYLNTYVNRDIQNTFGIKELAKFRTFITLCASRVGQLLNYADLSRQVRVNDKTIREWIDIMEASYILYKLPPYHSNISKRLVKSPKIYFHDTGLLCYLLDIEDSSEILSYPMKGALYENYIISELKKSFTNQGKDKTLYFYREKSGKEIDILFEEKTTLVGIECKATYTPDINDYKKLVTILQAIPYQASKKPLVVTSAEKSIGGLLSWRNFLHNVRQRSI